MPGVFSGIAGAVLGSRGQAASGVALVCRVAGAGLLSGAFLRAQTQARQLLGTAAALANGIAPVLAVAAAGTGRAALSASVTPMAALCTALMEDALSRYGLKLCGVLAAIAAAGSLSDALRLDRFFALGRRLTLWGLGLAVSGFMGMLSAQGLLASGGDGAASRAARVAVESLVPIIGREVSEALGSLTVSGGMVRSAVGVTSMVVVAMTCAKPVVSIAATGVAARLAGAVAELAGDAALGRMGDGFGAAIELMLAMCLGGALLTLLLAGGVTALGGLA